MSKLMKLRQYFLFCDLYARASPTFTVKASQRQSSYFGSALSVLGLVLCLYYFADLI